MARNELPGRQLAIVGAGRDEKYLAELHALVAELGIGDDVVFVGGVSLEETVNFYRAADVFVYPSLNETFGLPILEAMACGCPVVTSNVSAMPETAGGAAVLADPKAPESHRPGDRRSGTARQPGPAARPWLRAREPVQLGGYRRHRPLTSTARSRRSGRKRKQ